MVKRKLFLGLIAVLLVATFSFVLADDTQTGSFDGGITVDQDNPNGDISIDVGPSGGGNYNPYCGDGIINLISEYCDGSDLAGSTCTSILGAGYTGSLSCSAQCTFNTANCVAPTSNNTVITTSGGGGGGGGGSSCIENWNCTEWGVCNAGVQSRTCTNLNLNCKTTKLKPISQRDCSVDGASGENGIGLNDTNKGVFNNLLTGAFLGTTGGKWSVGVIIFLILVGLAWWIVAWKKKQED